jgi:uncharacterized protein YbjT (DUF2867 family)
MNTSVFLLLLNFVATKKQKMKIIITGSLGHISRPLTQELVEKAHSVTVISSKPEKQKDIEALGAIAAIGSLEDVDFLTDTFAGADVVYCMVPPNNYFDQNLDLLAYYRSIGNNYAEAIQRSGIKRAIHLSSIGAHLDKGTGLILGHNYIEDILSKLSNVSITFVRPNAFYYNLYGFLGVIKSTGMIASNYGASDMVVWVSPIDIAAAIAEEIVTPGVGNKVRYVASDELTANEVAAILGRAIGKPDLKWVVITDEQMQINLEKIGMAPKVAAGLVELNASMHTGELFQHYYLNRPKVMGKVKMTDFAEEFAAAFKQ